MPIAAMTVVLLVLMVVYRPLWVAILFGLTQPLGLIDLPGGLQVIIATSIVLVGVAVVDRLQRGLLPFPRTLASFAAVIWTLGIIISVVMAPNLFKTATLGSWQIVSAFVAIAIAELAGRPAALRKVLNAWLIGATLVALSGAVLSTGGLEASYGGAVVSNRPVGVFSQPNEYGLYCMVVVVFALGLTFATRGSVRWLSAFAALASGVGLLLSLSRGAWLGAVAGVIFLAMLLPQTRRPFLAGAALLFVGGAAASLLPFEIPVVSVIITRALTIGDAGSNPYDERPSFRAEGLREWQEKPIFGQGPNTFPELSAGINSVARPNGAEHPHNFFIAVGAEQGIIGVLAVLLFALAVFIAARAARPEVVLANREARAAPGLRPRPLPPLAAATVMAATAVLGAFMVEGFADYPMRNPLSRTPVWVMVGFALAGQRVLESARRERRVELATGDGSPGRAAEVSDAPGRVDSGRSSFGLPG